MLLGCERTSLLVLLTFIAGFVTQALGTMDTLMMAYAVAITVVGIPVLVHLGKKDPQYLLIFQRSCFYRGHYCATGRWDVVPRSPRKW